MRVKIIFLFIIIAFEIILQAEKLPGQHGSEPQAFFFSYPIPHSRNGFRFEQPHVRVMDHPFTGDQI